jgi:DNA polymerase elongation subunit (family B)
VPATYDFFISASDQHPAAKCRRDGNWWRVSCGNWNERADQVRYWTSQGVPTYEADVNPVRRYFVDHPELQIGKPYACYLDIEADSRRTFLQHTTGQSRVLCWTVKGKTTGKVIHRMLKSDCDADERSLLADFWAVFTHYDQVLAWNGGSVDSDILRTDQAKHGFDFYVIVRRSAKLGVLPAWWRKKLYLDHLACFKRNNMNSGDASEKVSFSLDSIGMAKLGRGKTDFDSSRTWEAYAAGGRERSRLGDYNVADVELECDIEKATDYLSVFQSLCEATWCFSDTPHLQPMRQVDGLMLSYGNKRGVHFKTKDHDSINTSQTFAGAYCEGPNHIDELRSAIDGLVHDVHVADFKSLYPSIMISMNISPELLGLAGTTCPVDQESLDKYGIKLPITFASDTQGVLPECVKDMLALREEWKQKSKKFPKGSPEEQEASRKSMAYKMAGNAFMGVASSPYSRYSTIEIGLAITRTGVSLIQAARDACQARGWKVIYIDTDSLFVVGPGVEEFKEFTGWCNAELFPKLASNWGCKTNTFFLDYEKAFDGVIFTYDSKRRCYNRKKYAYRLAHKGFTKPKPGKEIDVVGIEYKRGDSSGLARQLQKSVIDKLLGPVPTSADEIVKLIEAFRIKVFHEKHPVEQVMISKAIRKELVAYGEKETPHVKAAYLMQQKGQEVREGTKVHFVVVNGEKSAKLNPQGGQQVILAEDYKGDCDRYWLWTVAVFPGTYRIVKAAFPKDQRFEQYRQVSKYMRLEHQGQTRLFA